MFCLNGSGLIDIGDILVELKGPKVTEFSTEFVHILISKDTPASDIEQIFCPLPYTDVRNQTNHYEVELVLARACPLNDKDLPVMPSPVMMGPFEKKTIEVFRSKTSQGQDAETCVLESLTSHQVCGPQDVPTASTHSSVPPHLSNISRVAGSAFLSGRRRRHGGDGAHSAGGAHDEQAHHLP
jgi:hypothetical protein